MRKMYRRQQKQIQQDKINGIAKLGLKILNQNLQSAKEAAKLSKIAERKRDSSAGMLYGGFRLPCPILGRRGTI